MSPTTAPGSVATSVPTSSPPDETLRARFDAVRSASLRLAEPLSAEDCIVQPMTDASPTKWHLAHTTWFFETFVLEPHCPGYTSFHPQFSFLYNSYYNNVGERVARPRRGLMTRPPFDEVLAYRKSVEEHVRTLFDRADDELRATIDPLIEIGMNHEQQHQELILTDVKYLLAQNPLHPVYRDRPADDLDAESPPLRWHEHDGGLQEIGFEGRGFSYDNEGPRHTAYLQPFALASRPVTNAEYIRFIEDGGYDRPDHWLDLAWATVQAQGWTHPLYWKKVDGAWHEFTLAGLRPVVPGAPVCHLSYFEADAYARWAGFRLPTEQEWEVVGRDRPMEGNFVEADRLHPAPIGKEAGTDQPHAMYGDVWEWTRSHYSPYPGYVAGPGALGEYNGKFMCNQFVLRGGSWATPGNHIRPTYRNFWPPDTRFQIAGLRLAKDAS